jgi:hypothetical protein
MKNAEEDLSPRTKDFARSVICVFGRLSREVVRQISRRSRYDD